MKTVLNLYFIFEEPWRKSLCLTLALVSTSTINISYFCQNLTLYKSSKTLNTVDQKI